MLVSVPSSDNELLKLLEKLATCQQNKMEEVGAKVVRGVAQWSSIIFSSECMLQYFRKGGLFQLICNIAFTN